MAIKVAHEWKMPLAYVRTLPLQELENYVGFLKLRDEESEKELAKMKREAKLQGPQPR